MRTNKFFLAGIVAMIVSGCTGSGADTVENSDTDDGGGSVNSAPTISGSPSPAVNVEQLWSFTPSASDPDGDTLTFSVENKPNWTSFDSASGELSGTPTAGDIGVFSNIRVSVSDGLLNDSLSPFSVEVTQVALGSLTLAWSLPTLYSDGSPLAGHAAGVNLYFGTAQGNYPNKIEITNIGTTSYVVENLVPDTYHFVATVIDDQGIESNWSNIGSATVQ